MLDLGKDEEVNLQDSRVLIWGEYNIVYSMNGVSNCMRECTS
jgi:hypothetical protein